MKIKRFFGNKKRKTKISCDISSFSPNSHFPKFECNKKSNIPKHFCISNDEQINIRVTFCGEHRQRITNGNHFDSVNIFDALNIFLCTQKKLFLMKIWSVFDSHGCNELFFKFVHYDRLLIANFTFSASGNDSSSVATTASTRDFS